MLSWVRLPAVKVSFFGEIMIDDYITVTEIDAKYMTRQCDATKPCLVREIFAAISLSLKPSSLIFPIAARLEVFLQYFEIGQSIVFC